MSPDMQSRPGHLSDDGERVQCHECGRWYRSLQTHIARIHGIDADQYRAMHGLPRTQPLASMGTREKWRTAGRWRRDNDPSVLAALNGDKAERMRRSAFPAHERVRATTDRMADGKRRVARERLDRVLAGAGFSDLADAAAWAESLGLGWAGLASALGGMNHSWLAEVGAERGVSLTPPPSSDAEKSRRYLEVARSYARRYGSLNVPTGWTSDDGVRLGRWLVARRYLARAGRSSWVMDALNDIDGDWCTYGRK